MKLLDPMRLGLTPGLLGLRGELRLLPRLRRLERRRFPGVVMVLPPHRLGQVGEEDLGHAGRVFPDDAVWLHADQSHLAVGRARECGHVFRSCPPRQGEHHEDRDGSTRQGAASRLEVIHMALDSN